MILKPLIALVPIGFVLILSEILWRKKVMKGERARKFIHILAGAWMAFWSVYLPFDGIFMFGAMALTLLLYSRFTKLLHAIYAVKRKTYGDILFAVAIMTVAFTAKEPWIYTVAILLLAVADGGAAVVGRLYGRRNHYKVFGSPALQKSIIGSLAFLVLAYASILVGAYLGGSDTISANILAVFIVLPLGATVIENVTPYGFDNLITPLFATILLNSLL